MKSTIEIRKASIVDLDTDAVVNAANERLSPGGGVCGAIFRAAGYQKMKDACDVLGRCGTGDAVITPGFGLKARYVIHAVGPVWNGGGHGEPEKLKSAYRRALELARIHGCGSVGFPLISAGICGYPMDQAWQEAVSACVGYIRLNGDHPLRIVFAVLDEEVRRAGKAAVRKADADAYTIACRDDWKTQLMPETTASFEPKEPSARMRWMRSAGAMSPGRWRTSGSGTWKDPFSTHTAAGRAAVFTGSTSAKTDVIS